MIDKQNYDKNEFYRKSYIDNLLGRANLFLEDKDFINADIYAEKVLDLDYKNANAYLVKLLAENGLSNKEELLQINKPIDNNLNYQKIIRFGNNSLVDEMITYCKQIKKNSFKLRTTIYSIEGKKYINYGSNKKINGLDEAISWLVLKEEKDRILVISEFIIDFQKYHDVKVPISWEFSSLRKWLNDNFLLDAFDDEEKSMIMETEISADNNDNYDSIPGNNTIDNIFLLSVKEAQDFFVGHIEDRRSMPIDAIKNKGLFSIGDNYTWWWLRTPGKDNTYASFVYHDAGIDACGSFVDNEKVGVRPCMWIKKES